MCTRIRICTLKYTYLYVCEFKEKIGMMYVQSSTTLYSLGAEEPGSSMEGSALSLLGVFHPAPALEALHAVVASHFHCFCVEGRM